MNKDLKNSALNYLERLSHIDQPGKYSVVESGGDSVFTSCAAVFILDLLNEIGSLRGDIKARWINYIQKKQDPDTGYFSDENKQKDFKGIWEKGYISEQASKFSLLALAALNAEPLYNLKFLEKWKGSGSIEELKRLDWREPWYQSNKVMYRLSLLIDDHERKGSKESLNAVNMILDWLDSWQDPETGLWGTDRGTSLYHGIFTAFHFLYFYFYIKRPLNHVEKIIDITLSAQNRKDGLFSPHGGGGTCPDLDAIDILVKCSLVTEYKAKEIESALLKAHETLLISQRKDGGFCWTNKSVFTPVEWINKIRHIKNKHSISRGLYPALIQLKGAHFLPRGYRIKYSGLDYLTYYSAESDIFSTWFRLISIALIESRYQDRITKKANWKFPVKAGLGWHNHMR